MFLVSSWSLHGSGSILQLTFTSPFPLSSLKRMSPYALSCIDSFLKLRAVKSGDSKAVLFIQKSRKEMALEIELRISGCIL